MKSYSHTEDATANQQLCSMIYWLFKASWIFNSTNPGFINLHTWDRSFELFSAYKWHKIEIYVWLKFLFDQSFWSSPRADPNLCQRHVIVTWTVSGSYAIASLEKIIISRVRQLVKSEPQVKISLVKLVHVALGIRCFRRIILILRPKFAPSVAWLTWIAR
jgi:hypothetical protein